MSEPLTEKKIYGIHVLISETWIPYTINDDDDDDNNHHSDLLLVLGSIARFMYCDQEKKKKPLETRMKNCLFF